MPKPVSLLTKKAQTGKKLSFRVSEDTNALYDEFVERINASKEHGHKIDEAVDNFLKSSITAAIRELDKDENKRNKVDIKMTADA